MPKDSKRASKASKVAIIGFTEDSRHNAPWTDPDWECWGMNNLHHVMPDHLGSFTRWFQLHNREYLKTHWARPYWSHLPWLREPKHRPWIYVWDPDEWPDVPAAVRYPRETVIHELPRGEYHLGSFDWMVALAILERFTHIGLYGVNFSSGGEPIGARACLEYWLGVAAGRGITIETQPDTDLFKTFQLLRSERQYGYEDVHLVEEWPIDR